jgi:uncharacterized repeat protein (TIGR03803 family)
MQARILSIRLRALCIIFAVALLVTSTWAADHEMILHDFGVPGGDGTNPTAGLILDAAGNLYGTTYGVGGYGTVFQLSPGNGGGWTETILHNFPSFRIDGDWPYAGLMMDGSGNLYGTTDTGGLSTNIYGCACGTVFELSPGEGGGWSETQLHRFIGGLQDGAAPAFSGVVMDAAGNVYGTTERGGAYGDGIVFKLSPVAGGGWTETVLHNFGNGTDGNMPDATLIIDAAGNLYGTTYLGGVNGRGTVFEMSPGEGGGWTETVLHNFSYSGFSGGAYPQGGVIMDAAGNLYGTTSGGGFFGNACGQGGCGTVFELSPRAGGGWTQTRLYSFHAVDGIDVFGGVIMDAAGNLYGATHAGGTYGYGVAFKMSPTEGGWTETVLHSFGSGTDGIGPYGDVVMDGAGNLYGTTFSGGSSPYCTDGCGVVWEITP